MTESMPLWAALGIRPGDVVAFTGGGGKTSLALALIEELSRAGRPAVFTTTTRIFPVNAMRHIWTEHPPETWPPHNRTEQPPAAWPPHNRTEQPPAAWPPHNRTGQPTAEAWLEQVASSLEAGPVCLGARFDEGTGKVVGISPEDVALLKSRLGGQAVILVEADGSAGHPLKAPAAHEPVIPPSADLVVPVAGASILGKPLTPAHVHRAERVAELAGAAPGSPISPETVAAALLAPEGCTRGRPPEARVVPVIGQADLAESQTEIAGDAPETREQLSRLARLLADQAGRVVLAAPQRTPSVRAVHGDVVGIVLAGGASRRFGGAKLLQMLPPASPVSPTSGGRTVLEAALDAPLQAALREVIVVTGAYHEALAPILTPYPARVVPNPNWEVGMSSSMQVGIRAVPEEAGAVVICLGDQPALPPLVIDQLIAAWRRTGGPIVAPVAGGRLRNPVLFDRSLLPELMQVTGDEGGRSVVRRHEERVVTIPFSDVAWFHDIDTPTDLLP